MASHLPDFKLFASGRTCIGLRAVDGVVLAVEKPMSSKLLVPGSNKRIWSADDHIGIVRALITRYFLLFTFCCSSLPDIPHKVGAGVLADSFHLSMRACREARSYKQLYENPIPGKTLSDRLSAYIQLYTLYSSVRPFGTNVIVGCVDNKGPAVYMIETSGLCYVSTVDPPVASNKGLQIFTEGVLRNLIRKRKPGREN